MRTAQARTACGQHHLPVVAVPVHEAVFPARSRPTYVSAYEGVSGVPTALSHPAMSESPISQPTRSDDPDGAFSVAEARMNPIAPEVVSVTTTVALTETSFLFG